SSAAERPFLSRCTSRTPHFDTPCYGSGSRPRSWPSQHPLLSRHDRSPNDSPYGRGMEPVAGPVQPRGENRSLAWHHVLLALVSNPRRERPSDPELPPGDRRGPVL